MCKMRPCYGEKIRKNQNFTGRKRSHKDMLITTLPEIRAIVSEENRGVPNLYVVYVVYMYISRIIIFSSCH